MALAVLAGTFAECLADDPPGIVGGRTPGSGANRKAATNLYPVKMGSKYGYIDSQGNTAITARFDLAGGFSERLAQVRIDGTYSFIDTGGKTQFKAPCQRDLGLFSGGFCHGSIGLGFHYFDREGRLLPQRFAGVTDFSEGLAAVKIDPARFRPQPKIRHTMTGKWGFINSTGELVIPAKYDYVRCFSHGLAAVCPDRFAGKWGYIDRKGNLVIDATFYSAQSFSEGVACVGFLRCTQDHNEFLHAYIDRNGEYVIEPRKYYVAMSFHEGLAAVRGTDPDLPLWKKRLGFIDKQGNVAIVSRFSFARDFSEGLAAASELPRWDDEQKVWIQGKYGYIDRQGQWVIQPQFNRARDFVGGLAQVGILAEGVGYIDRRGRRIAWWKEVGWGEDPD